MNFQLGKLSFCIFGQSHSDAIGCVIDGFPPGKEIDIEGLQSFLKRRRPSTDFETPRVEEDKIEILSGLYDDKTCGAPLAFLIHNKNVKRSDYESLLGKIRPGSGDWTGYNRFNGYNDPSGNGFFSARLTAPLCIVGFLCLELLKERGIEIFSRVKSIGAIVDDSEFVEPLLSSCPVVSQEKYEQMLEILAQAKKDNNTLGGIVECIIRGVPAGVGNPIFDGLRNIISRNVFAIPSVNGIEFGLGFASTIKPGSESIDLMAYEKGKVKYLSNNCGGIQAGISTGEDIIFRVSFHPIYTLNNRDLPTIDLKTKQNCNIKYSLRSDTTQVFRSLAIVEAMAAISIYESLYSR